MYSLAREAAPIRAALWHQAPDDDIRGIAALVLGHGRTTPLRPALLLPGSAGEQVVTYGALAERIRSYAAGLRAERLPANARILLLAPPDGEILALALAVLACGMTIGLVDGRPGVRRLLAALEDAQADAVVAPPALLAWWPLVGALRRARRFSVGGWVPGARPVERLARGSVHALAPATVSARHPAIVSFTSGSTGRPKRIVRSHGVLLAQHRALAAAFPLHGIDLPGFPAAALHGLCCGATTLVPPSDLRRMADADPAAVLAMLERHGVTSFSGAPAFVRRLAAHVKARGRPVASVRRIVVGGGPVGRALCAEIRSAFPRASAHVVYGATEAEPIAACTLDDVQATEGAGFLVGHTVPGIELRLVGTDGREGEAGEIVVRGARVAGGGWHHTGDVGRLDGRGRLWLLGRAGDEVTHEGRTVHPYVAEAAALTVSGVHAAALVRHGGAPAGELVVALEPGAAPDDRVAGIRRALARHGLAGIAVRPVAALPMDERHGSKVLRAELVRRLERAVR